MKPSIKISKTLEILDAVSRLSANLCPPMERRIEQNLMHFELLRASGLTWRQIVLGLPSWSQQDGTPVSEDQVRGAYSRICRKKKGSPARRVTSPPTADPVPVGPKKLKASPMPPATAPPSSLQAQLDLTRKLRRQ